MYLFLFEKSANLKHPNVHRSNVHPMLLSQLQIYSLVCIHAYMLRLCVVYIYSCTAVSLQPFSLIKGRDFNTSLPAQILRLVSGRLASKIELMLGQWQICRGRSGCRGWRLLHPAQRWIDLLLAPTHVCTVFPC